MNIFRNFGLTAIMVATVMMTVGCGGEKPTDNSDTTNSTNASVDDHSGWWCNPHGIPEEECSMCSASYAKECKDKGDWCEEHNRAKSQCFKCDPTLAEKYAKLYEAKYGKKPPAITN